MFTVWKLQLESINCCCPGGDVTMPSVIKTKAKANGNTVIWYRKLYQDKSILFVYFRMYF